MSSFSAPRKYRFTSSPLFLSEAEAELAINRFSLMLFNKVFGILGLLIPKNSMLERDTSS